MEIANGCLLNCFWSIFYLHYIEGTGNLIKEAIDRAIKKRLDDIANNVIKKPTGGKYSPTTTTVAYNRKTGETFVGHSGHTGFNPSRLDEIHPELQKRVDAIKVEAEKAGKKTFDGHPSFEKWRIENCGEFNAINNALYNGATMNDISMKTVLTRGRSIKPPCRNCLKLYQGVDFVD